MATAQLPSSVGLPSEMKYNLDYSMPPESKSYSIRIQPSNVSQVTTSFNTGNAATTYWGDMAMRQILYLIYLVAAAPHYF